MEGDEVELDVQLEGEKNIGLKGDVCGYTVFNNGSQTLPFRVVLIDRSTGRAKVVLASGFHLDHEKTREYNFEIAAHSCSSGSHVNRHKVHIEVEDVNEYNPEWLQKSYKAEASEGQLFTRLVQLQAVDRDGYQGSSKICHYHVMTPGVPFEVDGDGFLRNTEPLDFNQRHDYIVEVVAEDCGYRRSDSAFVSVEVKPICRSEWTGISDRVEFVPKESQKLILPSARLRLCDGVCNLTRLSVTVTLSTGHIGKGCDHDTFSIQSQRELCGAVDSTVDLLPSSSFKGLTQDAATDNGHKREQIFAFDGKSAAIVIPSERVDPSIGRRFTISAWIKHEETDDEGKVKTGKETIVCHSDGEEMNRHHYSLFLHNCHLILLLRLEPNAGVDHNAYQPAEWRWSLEQICDGRWHHYAVSVNYPEVQIYVDGKRFAATKFNPEIVDDWPLHLSKHVHFTKLVVGACWHGGEGQMFQHFHGFLAGLTLLKNRTESEQVIQCLTSCQERLDFGAVDLMETGMSVSMNNEITNITITGSTLASVEKLIQRVSYVNTGTFPATGHRLFTVETRVTCANGRQVTVEKVNSTIFVYDSEKSLTSLDAQQLVETDEQNLMHGEKVFHDLRITTRAATDRINVKDPKLTKYQELESERYQLDSCVVHVNPPLTLAVEQLRYPEDMLHRLSMEADASDDGLVIAGANTLLHYEQVLSAVVYANSRPEELNSRTFRLSCTEMNGRFVSNQLSVTFEVAHPVYQPTVAPHAIENHKLLQLQGGVLNAEKPISNKESKKSTYETVSGVIVVCAVCIGIVSLLVILGVMRIRNAQRHHQDVNMDDKQEMEWDNSALTITVNPMDQETLYEDEGQDTSLHANETDSEDDGSFHYENEVDSSEEEEQEEEEEEVDSAKAKRRELEWDNSTLSF